MRSIWLWNLSREETLEAGLDKNTRNYTLGRTLHWLVGLGRQGMNQSPLKETERVQWALA